jgi:hypothetical protein
MLRRSMAETAGSKKVCKTRYEGKDGFGISFHSGTCARFRGNVFAFLLENLMSATFADTFPTTAHSAIFSLVSDRRFTGAPRIIWDENEDGNRRQGDFMRAFWAGGDGF